MFRKLKVFVFKRSKIAPLRRLKFLFFLSGVEVLQELGVEVYYRRLDRVKCKVI
jgi:hypothetical protein